MGFDTKTKPPKVFGNKIIVEGDITFDAKTIMEHQDQKQAYFSIVDCNNITNVRVLNNLGNTAAGRSVQAGMDLWNNVRNSTVRFVLVNRAPADITIIASNLYGESAFGTWPINGDVGDTITVDPNLTDGTRTLVPTANQWRNLIAHELGHNIGLTHNNHRNGVTQVPGTVLDDALSIMDSNGRGFFDPAGLASFPGLSNNDQIAVSRMYSNRRDRLCR